MYEDKRKYNYIGNGKLDAIQMANLGFTDAQSTCINLAVDNGFIAGEDAKKAIKQTKFIIEPTGDASSKVMLSIVRYMVDETGTALANGTVVSIGGTDYTCTSGGLITHEIGGTDYPILKDFVDAINVFPGIVATIHNALTTQAMNTDDFIAVSETVLADVAAGGVETLSRDASAQFLAVLRLGIPRANDRGPMQLLQVKGTTTDISNGTVKLIRDDAGEYVADASHQETYLSDTTVAAMTAYLDDNVLEAQTIRGPVCLVVESDDLTAVDMNIKYRQALAM